MRKPSYPKRKGTYILSAVLIASLLYSSCKKDEPIPATNCRITQLRTPGEEDLLITYNGEDRITSIQQERYISTFNYSGDFTTITKRSGDTILQKTSINNNSDGLAKDVRIDYGITGTMWQEYQYTYNGTVITRSIYKDYLGANDTSWYTFDESNLSRIYTRADTTLLSYYTDRQSRDGDYLETLQRYIWGYRFVYNKNLFRSSTIGTQNTTATYAFDPQDKISSMTVINPDTRTTSYTYQCR